jgi:hypothetical protein
MTKNRSIKLLNAYRRAGLGFGCALQRLDAYRKKHFGVKE